MKVMKMGEGGEGFFDFFGSSVVLVFMKYIPPLILDTDIKYSCF